MKESNFQSDFTRWKRNNKNIGVLFELKITKTGSLPFSRLEKHQKDSLLKAKHDELCLKLADIGYERKPADMFCVSGPAFVVVMFYSWGVKHFYLIDIDVWCKEDTESKRRSLTEQRCAEIGQKFNF